MHASENHRGTPNVFVRVWQALFRQDQMQSNVEAEHQKNSAMMGNQAPLYIQQAYLTPGGGSASSGGGSPVHIANLNGSMSGLSGGMSDEVRIALEKERTRQVELANEADLQREHERNRWFNTLIQYNDEQGSEQLKGVIQEGMKSLKQILDENTQKSHELAKIQVKHLAQKLQDSLHTFSEEERRASADARKKFIEEARALMREHMDNMKKIEEKKLDQLPALLAHDMEKTKVLHEQTMEKLRYIGEGIASFTQDKERVVLASVAVAGIITAAFVAKRGTKVAADYATALLMQPELVSKTSRKSLTSFARDPLSFFRVSTSDNVTPTFNESLQKEIDIYVNAIKAGLVDKQPYRHALFAGKPGTGKTLLATYIAEKLGMDYAIVNSANINDVQLLNKLFDWAEKSPRGTVLFLDEVDAIAFKRTPEMSESTRKVLNTFYSRTGTETNKTLLIGATNAPELLDDAYLSRMDVKMVFPLPDVPTRLTLLQLYWEKYLSKSAKMQSFQSYDIDAILKDVAVKTEGFSGRELSQFIRSVNAELYHNKEAMHLPSIVDDVLDKTLRNRNEFQKIRLTAIA